MNIQLAHLAWNQGAEGFFIAKFFGIKQSGDIQVLNLTSKMSLEFSCIKNKLAFVIKDKGEVEIKF